MNRLTRERREQVISCLVEGCSIRSTVRMTGVAKKTVIRLLVEAGTVCAKYHDKLCRNLSCRRLQVDELWAFCYAKEKNVTPKIAARVPGAGDVWLWVSLDAESKLVPCWYIGDRNATSANEFIYDLASRLKNRVQLTSDGLKVYVEAMESAFWRGIDYAMLVKMYGEDREKEATYSPAQCIGARPVLILGVPNPEHISTSYVERQNLSARMFMRRYTRLTNAFSKKIENHAAAVALYYFAYNFIKIHRTLRMTPAMAAGVTDRLWEVKDLVALLEFEEQEGEKAA